MAWRMWALAAVFYGFGFFVRVAPSVMIEELMRDLALGAAGVGFLASLYFYAYAAAQTPLGLLFDRFGVRRVVAGGAALAALGSFLFALGPNAWVVGFGRILVGMGVGAGYLGALLTARAWLPSSRFGLAAGLTLTVGMVGAIGAQAPLAALMTHVGWRGAGVIAAAAALALALALFFFLRDGERGAEVRPEGAPKLWTLLRDRRFWPLAATAGLLGAPILAWAGLWAVPYLQAAHGLDKASAGALTSLALAGWALGGPLAGFALDRLGRGRPILAGSALMGGASIAAFALTTPSLALTTVLLVVFGLASGGMVIAFGMTRGFVDPARIGVALGMMNTSVLLFGAILQGLLGALLDQGWRGETLNGARIYPLEAYGPAVAALVASFLLGLLCILVLREDRS